MTGGISVLCYYVLYTFKIKPAKICTSEEIAYFVFPLKCPVFNILFNKLLKTTSFTMHPFH